MRLICPNCGAQYEIADDVIPAAGRDVQCSNCGHTWFERPGASVAEEAGEDPPPNIVPPGTTETGPPAEPAPDGEAESNGEPEADTAPDLEPDPEPEHADTAPSPDLAPSPDTAPSPDPEPAADIEAGRPAEDDGGAAPAASRPVTRREMSPEIAQILRDEAEREEAQRRAEADSLESQPDLGLDAPIDRSDQLAEEARRRMARMRGEPAPAIGAAVTTESGRRKELFPDIDEINSSLRSDKDRQAQAAGGPSEPDPDVQRRKGARYGFSAMLILAAVLIAVYAYAPQIADRVPAVAGILEEYVGIADRARLWLDGAAQQIMSRING